MEDKYYVPDLSEFHVGFEYEWKRDSDNTPWTKSLMNRNNSPVFDTDAERMNDYRVKYLDKEDIEELGWEEDYATSYRTDELTELYAIGNKNKWYHLEYDNNKILITECEVYNEISGNWNQELAFKGTIKNKSELKKIMQMLEING